LDVIFQRGIHQLRRDTKRPKDFQELSMVDSVKGFIKVKINHVHRCTATASVVSCQHKEERLERGEAFLEKATLLYRDYQRTLINEASKLQINHSEKETKRGRQ